MTDARKRLERLDIAARAMVGEQAVDHERLSWIAMALFVALLGLGSTASSLETLAVRISAAVCGVIALLFWLNWRYSFHALALAWAAGGVAMFWFYIPHPHTVFGWTARCTFPLVFMHSIYRLLKLGVPFATARTKGWETERSQVHEWFELQMKQEKSTLVLDVPSGSFWTGYFTYRLIYLSDCWAVARFKTGNYRRLLDFRVLNRNEVRATQVAGGKLDLYLARKKVRGASPTLDVLGSLMRLAAPTTNVQ